MDNWINKLYEENSKLLGNRYDIPEEILMHLQYALKKHAEHKTAKGYKRANHIVNNPNQPFVNLVRIKNYFDSLDPNNINKVEFELNGGKPMNIWVQDLLQRERDRVEGTKVASTNAGMDNQFRKDSDGNDFDVSLDNKLIQTPDIMSNAALLESINKIKNLINKI
jgi:hypothetical protein